MRTSNPNHPVVQEMSSHWHKIAALMMFKLGLRELDITAEDMERFQHELPGGAITVKPDDRVHAIRLKLVTAEEAAKLVAQEDGVHYGVGKK